MQNLYVREVNISIWIPSLVSTNYSWDLVFSHYPVNWRTWLCLSTFLTRGVENDSLPAILSYLKEGDGVWRWSAQALHLPRLCLTASRTTGSHLGSVVEGLTSPAKLKTDSTIPSSPPPPAASHQIVPVLLLWCHVYPLLPPLLPQCRPGL